MFAGASDGEWVWLAGHGGKGYGDGVAVVAFGPGQEGVAQPMGGDGLGCDPGELSADAAPRDGDFGDRCGRSRGGGSERRVLGSGVGTGA